LRKSAPPKREEWSGRLYLVKPSSYVHVGTYVIPGYYTLLVFSARWCLPCTDLRRLIPGLLRKYKNLVFVDLDVGRGNALGREQCSILADLDRSTSLPAALLVNPFGLYLNRQGPDGIAHAISGCAQIIERVDSALAKRKHTEVIPMDGDGVRAGLAKLQHKAEHYALSKGF
jgi:hypothetical protein